MWKVTDVEWFSVPLFHTDNNTFIPYSSIELEENKNRHQLRGPHATSLTEEDDPESLYLSMFFSLWKGV